MLNLELWWEDGELRFLDPVTGEGLLSQEEEQDGRLAAEARAETAEVHAYEERSERLAAEARAETAETRAETAEVRAQEEETARLAAEARMAEMEEELRRLQGE